MGAPLYSVVDVVNYMIRYARVHGSNFALSNLKLQKLVYFAQGFALARLGRPLFRERIEAWPYGPLVTSLYEVLRGYGRAPVTEFLFSANPPIQAGAMGTSIIDAVMRSFGCMPASRLINISHQPGSPWAQVWNHGVGWRSVITLESMQVAFRELLQQASQKKAQA